MVRLAVVPGNSVDDIKDLGLGATLSRYYNPCSFFEQVFFLSPFETVRQEIQGIHVVPAKDTELPGRLRELKIDIVRGYGGATPADVVVFYRARGVPVVVSIHDKRPAMLHSSVRFADAVFVVSEELKGVVAQMGVRAERIFVIPNGVDPALMRPLEPADRGDLGARYPFRFRLLHVGRKSPEKNIEAIIRSLARLGPAYGLVAVGQGDPATYQSLARQIGVWDQCVFVPGVPREDLARFYNWADCVCHPSRSEAMCNVLLEALACGRPVVTTRTAARGLGEGPAAAMLLVDDPEDDAVLAGKIRLACEDHEISRSLADGARASVEHLFLEKTQAHEVACYKRVLDMSVSGAWRRDIWDELVLGLANFARRFGVFIRRQR